MKQLGYAQDFLNSKKRLKDVNPANSPLGNIIKMIS